MSILFACDLDNTLVYSYKKKQDGYICVEINKGREQGFMTAHTFADFKRMAEKAVFVPVTTRSVEQYRRIVFPNGYVPEYALVSNGATLIRNGEIDGSWNLICRSDGLRGRLEEVYNRYCSDRRFINCRIVDESYVFVYCANDIDAESTAKELADSVNLDVELSGRKIYFFPENLNKGNAVKKLNGIIGCERIISAGDSSMDVSMLNIADRAVIPSGFGRDLLIHGRVAESPIDSIFSDFVVDFIGS
ncbi:MAG: HAD hydrolase family protein [Ruminococcus flavefaciens]|nr:HAD hydrolase family protein [Ruminococcus flavefaciens]MCM1231075.1 HAD hydrolase family protein [Ruminococcus flavefaciens]